MALRRVFTLVLTGVCLLHWASPGDRGGQALAAGNGAASSSRSQFALRQPQPAGTRSGLEELTDALSGEDSFRKVAGQKTDGPVVAFLFPPGKKVEDRYAANSHRLYILKDGQEPSRSIDRDTLLAKIRQLNQAEPNHPIEYLATFVNDPVDVSLLEALPALKGITHMGLGIDNFTKEALQGIAERGIIRLSYVGRTDGKDPVLTGATAETLETLFLVQWFRLLERIRFVQPEESIPSDRIWKNIFQQQLPIGDEAERDRAVSSLADLHWAMLLRQAGKIDEAVEIPRRDEFRGALNGTRGTVRGHQLSSVPEIGFKTTLGFSGAGDFLIRWLALARAHDVDRILYTGPRDAFFEEMFGAEPVASLDEMAQLSDYVVVSPDDTAVLSRAVLDRLNQQRRYRWRVDSADWAVPEEVADLSAAVKEVLDSTLAGKRLGFLGLGHIGARTARFMAPFGAFLQSVKHNEANPVYGQLEQPVEQGGVGMQYRTGVRSLLSTSDGILAALPGGPDVPAYLAVENWPGDKPLRRRVWANAGRGKVFGDERKAAEELRKRTDLELAVDVITTEGLPHEKQPFLAPDLQDRMTVIPHIASNKESPARISVREDGMGMVMAENFEAMLAGTPQKELPNPVKLPARTGLEEANLKGVVFLVFDGGLGLAMKKQMTPAGAEVFVVAETPAIALKLISNQVAPDHIVGVLYAPKPEIDSPGVSPADYWKVNDKIRRFAYGEGGPQEWGALFAKRMQEGIARRVIPIYSAEQMQDQLGSLGVPGPVIQQILDQQTGLEEAFAGQA